MFKTFETEEDFQESVQFVKEAGFLMVHVFPYSRRQGTPAATMSNQVPEEIKHERVAILSAEAARTRAALLDAAVGAEVEVLFEGCENGVAKGHTRNFLEICCPVEHPCQAKTGIVRIERHDGNRCFGTLITHIERGS